ncbi:MAG: dipeptidase PepE [Bacteroidetes bacterium]|nr:dipeptidase PepE [Bacteroidota bacterium]
MRLLLLSNSTMPGQPYFDWPKPHVKAFLGQAVKEILFVPFAAVTISFNEYEQAFANAVEPLGYKVRGIHKEADMVAAVESAEVIAVGGGNTFQLVKMLHENELIEAINRVVKNGTPYMGWSAGSNVACPTVKTTNDMPIVYPPSFDGINLVNFQINPHFTNQTIPNHGGETRSQRLKEFMQVNQEIVVYGVPEGAFLKVEGDKLSYHGTGLLQKMQFGRETEEFEPGSILK